MTNGLSIGRLLHLGLIRTGRIRRRRSGAIPRILPKLLVEPFDPPSRTIRLPGYQLKLFFGVLKIFRELGPQLLKDGALDLTHSSSVTLFKRQSDMFYGKQLI